MLLPGALIVFMGFNAGGFFPATPAIAALVLAQVLLVRIMQARRPFEGLAPVTLVAIAALGLYALMTLLSASWSHSTSRALIEFDRAWLYLLILVLFGSVRASTQDLRWLIRGLVIGASVVCLAGLISRVLPDVWHTAPNVSNERLSYPVTYWNTLGLLAALGIVLAFHLTCSLGERRLVRVLAAAVVPLLAATLFFTFSRGAMAAGVDRPGRLHARGPSQRTAQRRARDGSGQRGADRGRLSRQPPGHGRTDHAGGRVAGSSRRAGGRHLRGRVRRPAAAARRRPGSPPAPLPPAGRDEPRQRGARRSRGAVAAVAGGRPRARASPTASNTTGTGSSAAPLPAATRATCASA